MLGGDTHNDCCGNVAFRSTGCRETTVAVGGEIVARRMMDSNCAGCSFRRIAIFADVRPETTGECKWRRVWLLFLDCVL